MRFSAARPPAVWAVGRNYADHAKEMGAAPPPAGAVARPMFFMKNPASVVGDGDPIVIPPICREPGPQVDYEGELAVVLGRELRDADRAAAEAAIGGYACANDVSARWWQKEGSGGQFSRGKSFDTFCPLSTPASPAQVGDPQRLLLRTRLNGEIVQEASTAEMLVGVVDLLVELSRGMTLLAGTVLLTGTPAGVGTARTPPRYLRAGDHIEVEIERVGRVGNRVEEGIGS